MFLRKQMKKEYFVVKNLTEMAFVTQKYSYGFDEMCGLQQIAE
jgi:hypothetical protein